MKLTLLSPRMYAWSFPPSNTEDAAHRMERTEIIQCFISSSNSCFFLNQKISQRVKHSRHQCITIMLVEWHCVETCSFISSAKDNTVHQPQKIQLLLFFCFFFVLLIHTYCMHPFNTATLHHSCGCYCKIVL